MRFRLICLDPGRDPLYQVIRIERTGERAIGTIRDFGIRHLDRRGWEAIGFDGHRAVHDQRWQAIWALTWAGRDYPFPVSLGKEAQIEVDPAQ